MEYQPLLLPELLSQILGHLKSHKSALRAAIRVSSTWAKEGTNILWESPPVQALAVIPETRRQYYANKIRNLRFDGDDGECHAIFRNLNFPGLKRISIDSWEDPNGIEQWFRQYLQPSLKSLEFYGDDVGDTVLTTIEMSCPSLRHLFLNYRHMDITPPRLLRFLETCKGLRSIGLGTGMNELLSGDVFTHLTHREHLEELEITGIIASQTVEDALRANQPTIPLQRLQRLSIHLESKAVPEFISVIKSLNSLTLTLEDTEHDVISVIASITNLRTLELIFMQPKEVSKEELVALGKLSGLHRLVLEDHGSELQAFSITDSDFARFSSGLPQLQELEFLVQSRLTINSLTSLAKNCPQLRRCEMLGVYELRTLNSASPLFPQLTFLNLGGLQEEEQEEEEGAILEK
jgi:hypothetical protein